MEIDYAAIIDKANTRKETLQQLARALEQAKDMVDDLDKVISWMLEVGHIFAKLDYEGVELIPKPQRDGLNHAKYRAENSGLPLFATLRQLCGVNS